MLCWQPSLWVIILSPEWRINVSYFNAKGYIRSKKIATGKYEGSLHWRHNDHDGVSNYQPHGCLLNRLFRRRSKKTSKLHITGLCVGNSPGPVNSPHNGPVTRKMFPFDDVIMVSNIVNLTKESLIHMWEIHVTHQPWISSWKHLWFEKEMVSLTSFVTMYCMEYILVL